MRARHWAAPVQWARLDIFTLGKRHFPEKETDFHPKVVNL